MSDPSRSSRSRGIFFAVALIIGLGASWWIFDGLSPNDGSRSAGGALTERDDSDSASTLASEPGARGVQGGEMAAAGLTSAEVGPGIVDAGSPPEADRPPTQAAGADGSSSPGANPEIDDAVSLEERARHARSLGRLDDAASYLELALSLKEEQLGPNHPSVAQTLGQLAGVYAEQGRDEEAEAAYQRAIGINQQSGSRTVLAAKVLSDLALFYLSQGRSDEALPLLESALDIELHVFGPEHPNVASRLAALGLLYRQQGLYDEAEPFLTEALLVRERVYALDDPETTGAMTSLAHLYRQQERYAEAEDLFQRALAIHENMDDQARVALDLANLSVLYISNDQFSDAGPVFERALRIEGQNPWSPTPMVSQGLGQLAHSAQAAGNPEQAEEIYSWALDAAQRVLGSESPNTAFLRDQYILYLRSHGRFGEAAMLEEG